MNRRNFIRMTGAALFATKTSLPAMNLDNAIGTLGELAEYAKVEELTLDQAVYEWISSLAGRATWFLKNDGYFRVGHHLRIKTSLDKAERIHQIWQEGFPGECEDQCYSFLEYERIIRQHHPSKDRIFGIISKRMKSDKVEPDDLGFWQGMRDHQKQFPDHGWTVNIKDLNDDELLEFVRVEESLQAKLAKIAKASNIEDPQNYVLTEMSEVAESTAEQYLLKLKESDELRKTVEVEEMKLVEANKPLFTDRAARRKSVYGNQSLVQAPRPDVLINSSCEKYEIIPQASYVSLVSATKNTNIEIFLG